MYDYHIHTQFSGDSNMRIYDAVEAAIKKGLKEIAFTDHFDLNWPDKSNLFEKIIPEKYLKQIEEASNKYEDKITIKKGIEIGIQPNCVIESKDFIRGWNYDFIILSIHCVDGIDLCQTTFYENKSAPEAFERYYKEILFAINEFEQFNVVGHLDLIRRYILDSEFSKPIYSIFYEVIDEILKTLISKGKGIEVNSSGYRYGLDSFMPERELIKRYKDLGGEIITVGSDAHTPEYVGNNIDQALNLIKDCGFNKITLFKNMNPYFKSI